MRLLADLWHFVAGALTIVLSLLASAHVVLHKRDSRAAVGWVGLIWLAPVVGAVLYVLFGVNRIQRRAAGYRAFRHVASGLFELPPAARPAPDLPATVQHLSSLARLVEQMTGRGLAEGNRITPLVNGDEAYPAMLQAIDGASDSLALSTYIFDNDGAGHLFVDALARAVRRGMAVRVLVDAVGARYSWPPIIRELKRRQVPVARFAPTLLPWRMPYMNLRNHRKLLLIDGRIGFTGGMNIREGHLLGLQPRAPIRDLQFRLEGPVVAHLMRVFAEDWAFTTGDELTGDRWFPLLQPAGKSAARGITDGPDEHFDTARYTLLGALACAHSSVTIVTPYFLPDSGLITALGVAAMRGVEVDIVLPERNNLVLVQWASTAQLWQVLQRGCRVWYTPPPFDHTKLMITDGVWTLFGSSNWDPRSLRLNFEFDVECYDPDVSAALQALVARKLARARRVTLKTVDGRSLPVRLRDGVARLAAPYL